MAEDGCSTTQDQIPREGASWFDVHLCSGGLQPGSHAKSDGAACLRAGRRSAGRGSADSAEPHGPHSSDALTLNRPRTPRRNLLSLAFQQPASGKLATAIHARLAAEKRLAIFYLDS